MATHERRDPISGDPIEVHITDAEIEYDSTLGRNVWFRCLDGFYHTVFFQELKPGGGEACLAFRLAKGGFGELYAVNLEEDTVLAVCDRIIAANAIQKICAGSPFNQ